MLLSEQIKINQIGVTRHKTVTLKKNNNKNKQTEKHKTFYVWGNVPQKLTWFTCIHKSDILSCGLLSQMNYISPHCAMTTGSFGLLLAPTGIFCWDKEILIQEQMWKQHNCTIDAYKNSTWQWKYQVNLFISIYCCHSMLDCWGQTLRFYLNFSHGQHAINKFSWNKNGKIT